MIPVVDLAAAFVALDLDPDDPADAADVALVRELVRRRCRRSSRRGRAGDERHREDRSRCPDRVVGPEITQVSRVRPRGPVDAWRMP